MLDMLDSKSLREMEEMNRVQTERKNIVIAIKNDQRNSGFNYTDIYKLPELMDKLHFTSSDFNKKGAINYHVNFNKMGKYSNMNKRK